MRYLLFIFICFLSLSPFSQTKLTEKQEVDILGTCNVYLEEQMLCYSDSTHSDQLFKSVASDTLYQIISMNREYYFLMGYDIQYTESKTNTILNNDTSLACIADYEEISFTLDVKEKDEEWIVYGYDNYKFTAADIVQRRNRLDTARIHGKQFIIIKQICTDFVTYWNELEETGFSENLQTSARLFQTLTVDFSFLRQGMCLKEYLYFEKS